MKKYGENIKQEALRLRKTGLSIRQIAAQLETTYSTIQRWCNPDSAQRALATHRTRSKKLWATNSGYRERRKAEHQDWYNRSLETRCQVALRNSVNRQTTKSNYQACTATVEELVSAYTGNCHICGISDKDCQRRLELDHCHTTGRFRGWLCHQCNKGLGFIGPVIDKAREYLND